MSTLLPSLDRVALVTGAGSGIGRAIALALARSGAAVAAADLHEETAAQTAAAIRQADGRALPLAGDVSDAATVDRWLAAAREQLGPVTILVNNAGLQRVAPVHEYDPANWDRLIGVMLTGPFLTTRAALPGMLEQGWGRIINLGSIHSLVASRYKSAYVAAKHGLLGLTKVVALETAGKGITVNCLCPSYVRTPLIESQIEAHARSYGIPEAEVVAKLFLPSCPLGRLLEPEEVAQTVLYLCSDAASGITGAALPLDGGWTAQ
jgi:3-hydroxybutyrate dehydrogenase